MIRTRLDVRFGVLLICGLCGYLFLTTSHRVSAYAEGPPASRTGAPGEGTCQGCHGSYPLNDPSGSVTIGGLPDSYVPGGDPLIFTVTVAHDGTNGAGINWGFEITVLDANNLFACDRERCDDTLLPTDTTTQSDSGLVGGMRRFYVKQTLEGTFYNPDGAPCATWSIAWTPPDTDLGPVTFYVAGNAANGDGLFSGDYIFVNNQTVLGPGAELVAHTVAPSRLRRGPKAVWPYRGWPDRDGWRPMSSH